MDGLGKPAASRDAAQMVVGVFGKLRRFAAKKEGFKGVSFATIRSHAAVPYSTKAITHILCRLTSIIMTATAI